MQPDPVNLIRAARGEIPADRVFSDAQIFNPFTCSWDRGSLAVKDGIVVGMGDYEGISGQDMQGAYLVPGLIDAHVHIESSHLIPREYSRLVAQKGTATVIADPHEIANVSGSAGIEYMLRQREGLAVDILYMLPSCVPATPRDAGGAVLTASDLEQFRGRDGILGLGEMMNYPGVLNGDAEVLEKIALFPVRDGHAPGVSGRDLNAYVLAGLQSDHECTTVNEAEEKLKKGMAIFIREGSTEQNIEELAPLVSPLTVPHCCFATDDCSADLLMNEGHIDRCIRKAVRCGVAPELAIRMATLSAAEHFLLPDRGALSPGRRADFCTVDDPERFSVDRVFVGGRPLPGPDQDSVPPRLESAFRCQQPLPETIRIRGAGRARVIKIIPGQIVTGMVIADCSGEQIPDTGRDILKVVVCNRYGTGAYGIGLVQGFKFLRGAIASTVAHDAHNLIAAGASDTEILTAIREVIRMQGGMAAVIGTEIVSLPLECGGLMSDLRYPDVVKRLSALHTMTRSMGGVENPFMYLSFLSLTVIPALRVTDRGVFDAGTFTDVPLFI